MKSNTGFFKTNHNREHGWMLNNHPIKKILGTKVEISGNKYNITPSLQKVFTETSNRPLKKLNDGEKEIYKNILEDLNFENYKPVSGEKNQVDLKLQKPSSEIN